MGSLPIEHAIDGKKGKLKVNRYTSQHKIIQNTAFGYHKIIPIFAVLFEETRYNKMKKDIHPTYNPVVFLDTTSDFKFLTRSTMTSSETIKWEDGNEYPLVKIEVSSASHPFYTGKKIFLDTAGRVEKFNKRYKK